ncbi:hypothetical protein G7Y89_g831 [Cudoniella acicularis]|uniref:Alcohol dehydrogenase-like N-terminal domain-containing protein n=1 Tax=Cudoniella acicularis TaxID=354080 RepID=A0A8H4W7Z3_9HELO|nr:hypothetical protein G7Y89_g831 [Cudoniella acicularis]
MNFWFNVYRGSEEGHIVVDTTTRTLHNNEVYIETTHSGICGSDEHFLKPGQVLGHEGIGIVRQVGPDVISVKVGDRVGFRYLRKVCGACDNCATGEDQHCRSVKAYSEQDYDLDSFSHGTVWDADCLFPIPDGYRSEDVVPLMCAGTTV